MLTHSFMQISTEYHCVPGHILSARDTAVNKTYQNPCLDGAVFEWRRQAGNDKYHEEKEN